MGKPGSLPSRQKNRADALLHHGRLQEAEEIYRHLIAGGTNHAGVFAHLAVICGMTGRLGEGVDLLNTAVRLRPDDPQAHNNLGLMLRQQGHLSAAIASFSRALQLRPDDPGAHLNLGGALLQQGHPDAAIASYRRALELRPGYPEAFNNLGIALDQQGDLQGAITSFRRALQVRPAYREAFNNLGGAFLEAGDLSRARAAYEQALQLRPDDPEAHRNLALALLLAGDYPRGWKEYEWRFKAPTSHRALLHAQPPGESWDGSALLPGDRLLLVSEQGLGDTLQFMRYVLPLRQQGVEAALCAPTKLHDLIRISGIDPDPWPPGRADSFRQGRWLPLLSLPRCLGVSPSNPILTEPYIATCPELIARWRAVLSAGQRPIIGINWQGNPDQETTSSRGRSLPLEALAPLAEQVDVRLLSLQKGFGSEQRLSCSFRDRFVSCQRQVDEAWDFPETAAIIASCDLIITSDTCVAHLAGGMGISTWLLLQQVPDWRWGMEGRSSFWYPSLRLFRQQARGDWDGVVQQVVEELRTSFPGAGGSRAVVN